MHQVAEYIHHADNLQLAAIVCESGKLTDELYTLAVIRDVPLLQISNVAELHGLCTEHCFDYAVMCSFGKRITPGILELIDIYNIHYAALPEYKGRHPTFYAVMNDEESIGISMHKVTLEIDQGQIIAQESIPNYFWDTEEDIFRKLTTMIPALLFSLEQYLAGYLGAADNKGGSYQEPVHDGMTAINLENDSLKDIYNKVRAQYRYGGSRLELGTGVAIRVKRLLFTDPAENEFKGSWIYDREAGIVYVRKDAVLLKINMFEVIQGLS